MKITLRALEPADIDAIYRWENDPAVWNHSAAHQPFSRHALQQFIDESSLADIYAARQLRLMADADGQPAGCIDLFDFDPHHRRAAIGIIVDHARRRRGIGKAMLDGLEDFAKEHLLLHQLHCIIAQSNTACLRLFTGSGYRQCGTLHEWLRQDGQWHDALFFQKRLSEQ